MMAVELPSPMLEAVPVEAPVAKVIPEDERIRWRVASIAEQAGMLAVSRRVEYSPDDRANGSIGYDNLMEAIWFAERGEAKARAAIETNTRTHILECLMKAGVMFDVTLYADSRGRLTQHGQLLEEVYVNALRWAADGPEMRERTLLETYNGLLGANWARLGLLRGKRIVVFSPYPTSPEMIDEDARRIGFFPETKSCAIQSLTMQEDGSVLQEVAFVAGVTEPDGERHDLTAIQSLLAELGADIDITSASSVLGTPIVLPGAVSLLEVVRRYDQHASSEARQLFFGQEVPSQDYEAYLGACRQRIASLESLVQATVDEVIRHASSLRHPLDAVRLLHDVAQQQMVAYAFHDRAIDTRVFGPEAVAHIEAGRQALAANDLTGFSQALGRAQATAQTGSCPVDAARLLSGFTEEQEGEGDYCPEVKDGQLVPCPGCKRKVRAIVPNRETIYCSNPGCDLAAPYLKQRRRPRPVKPNEGPNARAGWTLLDLVAA